MRRSQVLDLIDRDLVVAKDLDFQPGRNLAQPLDEVVGEAVVVIDQDEHARIIKNGGRVVTRPPRAMGSGL